MDSLDVVSASRDSAATAEASRALSRGFTRLLAASVDGISGLNGGGHARTLFELERGFCAAVRALLNSCSEKIGKLETEHAQAMAALGGGGTAGDGVHRARRSSLRADTDQLRERFQESLREVQNIFSARVASLQNKQRAEFRSFVRVTSSSLRAGIALKPSPADAKRRYFGGKDIASRVFPAGSGKSADFLIRMISLPFERLLQRFETSTDSDVALYAASGAALHRDSLRGILVPVPKKYFHTAPLSTAEQIAAGALRKNPRNFWMSLVGACAEATECQFPTMATQLQPLRDRKDKDEKNSQLVAGDFAITRHSNLRGIHCVFHVISEGHDADDLEDLLSGVRRATMSANAFGIQSIVVPLPYHAEKINKKSAMVEWAGIQPHKLMQRVAAGLRDSAMAPAPTKLREILFLVPVLSARGLNEAGARFREVFG